MCHGQILNHAIRKARKFRACTGCGKDIRPGTRYWMMAGKMDGEFYEENLCPICAAERRIEGDESSDGCLYTENGDTRRQMVHDDGWKETLTKLRAAWRRLCDSYAGRSDRTGAGGGSQ